MSGITKVVYEVQESDLDELEHVNNRVYVRWMEEAARAASAEAGWPSERYFNQAGGAWVAREHWVEYLRPCSRGDKIEVYTWVQSFSGSLSLRRYAMKNAGKLCCAAATEWVYIDLKTRRTADLPEEIARGFEIVPADDPRLKELGVVRCVRFTPRSLV